MKFIKKIILTYIGLNEKKGETRTKKNVFE